jgi:hypothetical protein
MSTHTLTASDDTPATARRLVHDRLVEWGYPPEVRTSAELLVSEVVTDALRQHPSLVTVTVEPMADDRLKVEVANEPEPAPADGDPSRPEQRRIARRFVERLSDKWATELDRTRTTTWFELSG